MSPAWSKPCLPAMARAAWDVYDGGVVGRKHLKLKFVLSRDVAAANALPESSSARNDT